jgi:hypothetical protein
MDDAVKIGPVAPRNISRKAGKDPTTGEYFPRTSTSFANGSACVQST